MKRSDFKAVKEKKKHDASAQILRLFEEAELAFDSDPAVSDRNVRKARRLSMKHKIRLPSSLKRKFCKHCNGFLRPGVNCRVRLVSRKVVYYCSACKKYSRFPYYRKVVTSKEQKTKGL